MKKIKIILILVLTILISGCSYKELNDLAIASALGIDYEKIQDSIREIFQRKGDAIVELNLKALAAGKEIAEKTMK